MAIDSEIQEAIARCVSILVCYHNADRSRHTTLTMIAEARAVAAWTRELSLGPGETDERILRPLEAEMIARYGHELGSRLNHEFLKAFEDFGTFEHLTPAESRVASGLAGRQD